MKHDPTFEDEFYLIGLPSRLDGRTVVMEYQPISGRMIPVVGRYLAALGRAERHTVSYPYADDGVPQVGSAVYEMAERELRRGLALDALERGLSVLSISLVRAEPDPVVYGYGQMCLDYVGVPMAEWEEQR